MKNRKLYRLGIIFGMACSTIIGCNRLENVPTDRYTDDNYWTTVDKAQLQLNNVYMYLGSPTAFFYNEGLSDNAYNGRNDVWNVQSISSGAFDNSLGRFQGEFKTRYVGIKACNTLLDNIDRVPIPADKKEETIKTLTRMKAEARIIRAWLHFQLANWWGDIPLEDHTVTLEEAKTIKRTPHAEVIKFVLDELDSAIKDIPSKNQLPQSERGRITSGAVLAMKARILLYEGRWAEVVSVTDAIINGEKGNYSLFPSYPDLFISQNDFNDEDVLSLQFANPKNWGELFHMVPLSQGAAINALAPTQELVDSYIMLNGKKITDAGSGYDENNPYKNRDPRLTYTVVYDGYQWKNEKGETKTIYIKPGSNPDRNNPIDEFNPGSSKTPTGYYTRKYWDPKHMNNMNTDTNIMLIRYADVLLMNAEAKNELGQFDAATWDKTIGALRKRAGFTDAGALNYPALSQGDMRDIIRNERRSEFAMEGLRIDDIRRWRIAEKVMNGWVHGARFGSLDVDNGYIRVGHRVFDPSKHYLWPIHNIELNINPNLGQNPGY